MKKTISVLGCGWFGLALAKQLIIEGYCVNGSTTSANKISLLKKYGISPYLINTTDLIQNIEADFFKCDVLIIAIPPKNNDERIEYYPKQIEKIAALASQNNTKNIILISSTGIYEDGNFIVNEDIKPQPNTPGSEALKNAEQILNSGLNSTIIRFGGLIGPDRHLAKHFAGKHAISNGLAPINLIHLTDCIGLTISIIQQEKYGYIYHGVSPSHPTRKEFYTAACEASQLARPNFIAEKTNWKQVESKNVASILNYSYVYSNWDIYFKELAMLSIS